MRDKRAKQQSWLINALLILLIIGPLLLVVIWSGTARWPYPALWPEMFTLRAYKQLLMQWGQIKPALGQSLFISCSVGLLSLVLGLLNARVYVKLSQRGQTYLLAMMFLPMLIPSTVFAMGIHLSMLQWGLANKARGVILVHLLYSLPYANFLLCEAYANLGMDLEEQAYVMGAGRLRAFWCITFPLLSPVLLAAMVMSYIISFSQYFITALIGGGLVRTYALIMFPYLQANDRTIASVFSLVFLLFTFVVFLAFTWLLRPVFAKPSHVHTEKGG